MQPTSWACEAVGRSGVFETLRTYHGTVYALEAHLERLLQSARTLGLVLPKPRRVMAQAVQRMGRACAPNDAVIRAAIVPGVRGRSRLIVMAIRLAPYPLSWYTRGVAAVTAVTRRGSPGAVPPQAKHADLLPGIMARLEGVGHVVELLYRTDEGWIAEGTVSNLCIVTTDRRLASPPPAHGALAGVTCQAIFRFAAQLGLRTAWTPLTRHDIWNAAEVFVTNTTLEVLPVVRYDGRVIGAGRPGPWTRTLHQALRSSVREKVLPCA